LRREKVFGEKYGLDADSIFESTLRRYERFRGFVKDVSAFLLKSEGSLLFEGAQGTMLDVDAGTYPYVTSSNSSALGLSNGTGLPPKFFADAYMVGVAKAYTTRVGEGPFPTELKGSEGDMLRDIGGEFGSTTGRPRRCGWLDLVALRYAVEVNRFDGIILTKLDVLDSFGEIRVCVGYEYRGERLENFPASLKVLQEVKPIYKTLRGWLTCTKGIKSVEDLPPRARDYIAFIEDFTGVPVIMLSTGPRREEFVWLRELPGIKASCL